MMSSMFYITLVLLIFHLSFSRSAHSTIRNESRSDPGQPLILTPLIEANRIEEARNVSQVCLKGMENIKSYSGYLTVNKQFNSNMFFWFFPSQTNYEQDPVVLWLEGGPGGTTLIGLFLQHGPFIVTKNLRLKSRKITWIKNHSVIYIDNPVGTGFSFTNGGFARNQTDVGRDLYTAMIQFFQLFPELQTNKFIIAGESFAGKYVPAIAYTIHKNNPTAKIKINLKGMTIGNGYCDAETQFYFDEYLYQLGLVDLNEKRQIRETVDQAVSYIRANQLDVALKILDDLVGEGHPSLISNMTGFTNLYNYLVANDTSKGFDYVSSYVQRSDIRAAIHVGNTSFLGQTEGVVTSIVGDSLRSVGPWVSELLNHYKILFYNGQLDIIVAYPLTLNFLQNLNFSAAEEYKSAKRHKWYVDGVLAGYEKRAGNLTEVLVRNAGHLVPIEQPKWALDLLTRFTHNEV